MPIAHRPLISRDTSGGLEAVNSINSKRVSKWRTTFVSATIRLSRPNLHPLETGDRVGLELTIAPPAVSIVPLYWTSSSFFVKTTLFWLVARKVLQSCRGNSADQCVHIATVPAILRTSLLSKTFLETMNDGTR
jgi:hypothetical protein